MHYAELDHHKLRIIVAFELKHTVSKAKFHYFWADTPISTSRFENTWFTLKGV